VLPLPPAPADVLALVNSWVWRAASGSCGWLAVRWRPAARQCRAGSAVQAPADHALVRSQPCRAHIWTIPPGKPGRARGEGRSPGSRATAAGSPRLPRPAWLAPRRGQLEPGTLPLASELGVIVRDHSSPGSRWPRPSPSVPFLRLRHRFPDPDDPAAAGVDAAMKQAQPLRQREAASAPSAHRPVARFSIRCHRGRRAECHSLSGRRLLRRLTWLDVVVGQQRQRHHGMAVELACPRQSI